MLIIKRYIFTPILFLIGLLPIELLRLLGAIIGVVGFKLSKKARLRTCQNLLLTKIANQDNVNSLARKVAQELGKSLIETICIAWMHGEKSCNRLIKESSGLDLVLDAQNKGQPMIFLTPHIGNFEILVKWSAYYFSKNLTILYKPSKDPWFHQLMLQGRTENNIKPVPTNSRGILQLIRALKSGEYVGILPDSVASKGDGVWVNFFGNRVFATTLLSKMVHIAPDAKIFIAVSKRIRGGFRGEFIPYHPLSNDVRETVQDIYTQIERIISKNPLEYFWSYDRFRVPDHAR